MPRERAVHCRARDRGHAPARLPLRCLPIRSCCPRTVIEVITGILPAQWQNAQLTFGEKLIHGSTTLFTERVLAWDAMGALLLTTTSPASANFKFSRPNNWQCAYGHSSVWHYGDTV